MTSIVDVEELGRRIRKLRSERRMTLKQVEHASGLSATHLSEIERGRTSPTIGALTRIARALEKDVAYFVEQEERAEVAHHLREHVAGLAAGSGVTIESLSPGIPGSGLFTYRVRLEPGPGAELRLPAQELPADAVVHVHSGRVAATVGASEHQLGAGDTLQASLALGHSLRAGGGGAAEFYLVSTRALEEIR
jgi:transcriptional regulator with XRE-family HTH domain